MAAMFTLLMWNAYVFCVLASGSSVSLGHWNGDSIDGLLVSKEDLEIHAKNSTAKWPFCVLYRDPNIHSSKLEERFKVLLRNLPPKSFLKNWTIATFNLDKRMLLWEGHPGSVPVLQCHIWTSGSPVSYPVPTQTPITTSSLLLWFKNVKKMFASRLLPLTSDSLSNVIESHGGYTLVGVPGHLHHQTVENNLNKVAKRWKKRIKTFIVIPLTDDEMFVMQTFNISQLPAVMVFNSQEWKEMKRPLSVLQDVHDVEEGRLEIFLVTLHSQAIHLNLDNFVSDVLETKHPQPPIIVCFYSPRSSHTLNYLNGFHRSHDTFTKMRISLRFGMLNIVDYPQVISRYVNASDVNAVPFTVAFWQEREVTTRRFVIKQQVFDRGIPTPQLLYDFLQMLSVTLISSVPSDDDSDQIYNPWKESSDSKNMCYPEVQKDTCDVEDNNTVIDASGFEQSNIIYGPALPPHSWQTKVTAHVNVKPKTKKLQFSYVNDKTWASLIEQSVGPVVSYMELPRKQSSELFSVALVVFLIDGCSYCVKVMPTIEKISIDAKYIGTSLYIHNCSSDPHTCQRYGITGYPTLTAFRSLSWSAVHKCSSSKSTYLRLDYHGPVTAKLVLEWLSNVSQPAVDKSFLFRSLPDMDVDVRLIGTVYTRTLARRYLAPSLINKWYPFYCFQLICELLFGRVPCYATYTRDVVDDGSKMRAKEEDLVLSKLELQRSDGVRVKVFQLGRNVEYTINNQRDSRLHMFHDVHRYDLPKNFKCEHDHSKCTDVAIRFIHDHRRLPVLHMTSAAFHTKLGSEEDASFEPFAHNLPILLALAHRNNITKDSSFYKELTEAAYALYRDMVFVTLDIEEFAHWASRFVPKDYHAEHAFGRQSNGVPALYHYPRLCIIQPDDHQHAAFYPPVKELQEMGTSVQARLDQINSQHVIKFAQDYMKDPAAAIVKTEFF